MKYRYPCTRHIEIHGFGSFLETEMRESRYNLNRFTSELQHRFEIPYLTLVNSGSSANLVAALVLAEKIKRKKLPMTAAVSAFTFPTTISSLIMAGFQVTAIDTAPGDFNISFAELQKLSPLPSVIAVTHFLGFPCAIREITEYAHQNGSLVLQDACETLGMQVEGQPVFRYGDITTWSFYHPHHMSSYGGGAVITLSQEDYIMADSVAHWGRSCKCHIDEKLCTVPAGPGHQFTYERLGVNVEMSELNACFGRWQLRNYGEMERRRLCNYDILYDRLSKNSALQVWKKPDIASSPFVFPIRLMDGATIYDLYPLMRDESIEMRTLMGGVSNEQAAFAGILGTEMLTNAHNMAESTFFVGIHQTLPENDVRHVASRINELVGLLPSKTNF